MNYKLHTFDNIGFLHGILSEEELFPLKQEILKIQNNFNDSIKNNPGLAGNIKKEYRIIDSVKYLENLLLPYIDSYDNFFHYSNTISLIQYDHFKLILNDVWVNFQKKYEFNPIHRHTGVMSFVIWVKIPYFFEDERKQFPDTKEEIVRAGTFNFYYTNSLGKISEKTIYADREFENHILIFPAEMFHAVYPFYTSEDYRISVSGNFQLDICK